ncbi:MAG: hypothetical protein ABFD84_00520 [Candidatus Polarisedimenticolia bacterium]|nr:hypothetical protein [bacterium]
MLIRSFVRALCHVSAAAAVAVALAPSAARAEGEVSSSTADDQARLLAGLPVSDGSPLKSLEETAMFKTHAKAVNDAWARLDTRLDKMTDWAKSEVWPKIDAKKPLLYLFGGPDAIGANVLFPDAPAYYLAGLEWVGNVPPPENMKEEALAQGLNGLRIALRTSMGKSFFVTKDMSADLTHTELKGVMPILYIFLVRSGHHIVDRTMIQIDADGKLQEIPPSRTDRELVQGVRIRFRDEGSERVQELYYFRIDLADKNLSKRPGFYPFLKALGPFNSFLKAASFILHDPSFTVTKNFILDNSDAVLQDDSGMPYRAFRKDRWDFHFYGKFSTPTTKAFQGYKQPDLARAVEEAGEGKPLPFLIGYSHPGKSFLLLATRKAAKD